MIWENEVLIGSTEMGTSYKGILVHVYMMLNRSEAIFKKKLRKEMVNADSDDR